MRMHATALAVFGVFLLQPALSQHTSPSVSPKAPAISNEKMPAKVPAGTTFALFDSNGKPTKTLAAGQKVGPMMDCVLITCPTTFAKGVRCWRCR